MAEEKRLSAQKVLIFAAGLGLGLVLGFFLTNYLNRQELEQSRADASRRQSPEGQSAPTPPGGAGGGEFSMPDLTEEQLRQAVTQADANAADAGLQRTAGQALYLYAVERGNSSVLPDAARFLGRAHEADPKDYNTAVFAGNANLILARGSGDASRLAAARRFYERALAARPDDVAVRTTLGLTYFLARPPDTRAALREYRRALGTDPRNELTLQSIAAALVEAGELDEAERRLGELESVNASNPELPNLRAQLEQKRNAAKERP